MQKLFLSLFLLLSVSAAAQNNYTVADKVLIASRVDSLVQKYLDVSRLSDASSRAKKDSKDAVKSFNRVISEFKKLFELDAKIFDDINPEFNSAKRGSVAAYELKIKDRLDYIDGLSDNFQNGLIINNKQINLSYSKIDEGIIQVAISRYITGTSYLPEDENRGGYNLVNDDTIKLVLAVQTDKTVKIRRIEEIGSNLKITNDKDYDGVINDKDDCDDKTGLIKFKGCPDRDSDGIPDKKDDCPDIAGTFENNGCPPGTSTSRFVFSGSVGFMFNSMSFKTPESGFGYGADMDLNKDNSNSKVKGSDFGDLKGSGLKGSLALNGSVGYYFGKKANNKNKGITFGINIIRYTDDYEFSTPVRYVYHDVDGSGDNYKRIVSMKEGTEALTYNILNFPLMFKYRFRFGQSLGFEFGAGPSFMTVLATSKFNGNFSYEGLYEIENGDFIYNSLSPVGGNYLNLTAVEIENSLINDQGNANAQLIYDILNGGSRGYDFDFSKDFGEAESKPIKARAGFAFNTSADLMYQVSSKSAIKIGFAFMIAPTINNKNNNYKMVDATGDKYDSVYNSNTKATYTSIGFNAGLVIGFGK